MEGIGEVKAVKIKCIAELSARMAKQHAAQTLDFKTPSSMAEVSRAMAILFTALRSSGASVLQPEALKSNACESSTE